MDGKQEARLVGAAVRPGHVNWTLHLLADKVVELEFAGSISLAPDTQKNELKPWRKKEIPKLSGEFVARMEDVLFITKV